MSSLHELPEVPALPPLEMPSQRASTSNMSLGNLPVPRGTLEPANILPSPAPSFAESFSTAYTSPIDQGDEISRFGLSSLAPPQSLRKSVSVDSFAKYGRDNSHSNSNHSPISPESPRSPVYGEPIESSVHPEKKPWVGRLRGESLSSVNRDYGFPPGLDSDNDRYDPLSIAAVERFRRMSLKNQDPLKPSIRGGDLPLPSRSQTSSMTGTPTSATPRESLTSVPSSSSVSSTSRRPNHYSSSGPGRTRSGSLGYNPPSTSKRMVINTHVTPTHRRSLSKPDFVVAVIGTSGCGKSTVIKKGLSGYGLSEPIVVPEDGQTPRYIRRTSNVSIDFDRGIEVIELDVQTTSDGLTKWPSGLPPLDGVLICYDSSKKSSFQPVEGLLKRYRSLILPIMVLGCKADLVQEVDPGDTVAMLKQYDTGLIEVSTGEGGKDKMKQSFMYLLKAVLRQRGPSRTIDNRNPASPQILTKGEANESGWPHTPSDSPLIPTYVPTSLPIGEPLAEVDDVSSPNDYTPASPPLSPLIPTNGDMIPELDLSTPRVDSQNPTFVDSEELHPDSKMSPGIPEDGVQQALEEHKNGVKKELRPTQWAHLDELLDKLLFLAVSGDDPTYGTHFLLTYRRFATPRSLLLAMQKRMRQLDNPSGDPMFACFAQMRICYLLETWIHDYPHDFAVKGTVGALNALIKSIISKTHLLHYGSEFLPFLEELPTLVDLDSAWALKADVSDNDSDDYNEDDDDETRVDHEDQQSLDATSSQHTSTSSAKVSFPSRERKASLPLPKAISPPINGVTHIQEYPPRQHIRDLVKVSQEVVNLDSDEIAQEITRQNVQRFLDIKPRDWLHFTFVSGRKTDTTEPIAAFNTMSNHLADWVISLILCHDRPRHRARQMEKFVEIAQKLRHLNNYSALRAFVAGINIAADESTMELFKAKCPDAAKALMSWDVLLQQLRSHRAYRLALRNSKGACIPALEVHMSDLIKAHEGNGDINEADPTKIHWGKFNMMGRFITNTLQCQAQCRNSIDYNFQERTYISELFTKRPVMSIEMQKSRLKSNDVDYDGPRGGLRELFFW